MATNEGKIFEQSIEQAASDQSVFFFRVRDVNPMALKHGFTTAKNKYDALLFHKGYLFPTELKSTKGKSISMKESMIKAHQIKSLKEANQFEKVVPGFIFNFRLEDGHKTYFVHIEEFLKYQNIAENQLENDYINKINKSSMPERICAEVGVEVKSVLKKVKYRYYINHLLDQLIERYEE